MEAFKLSRGDTIIIDNLPFELIDVRHSRGGGTGSKCKVIFSAVGHGRKIVDEIVPGSSVFVVVDKGSKARNESSCPVESTSDYRIPH
jgi:translation elongation factor P/translation initiation factor 5A